MTKDEYLNDGWSKNFWNNDSSVSENSICEPDKEILGGYSVVQN